METNGRKDNQSPWQEHLPLLLTLLDALAKHAVDDTNAAGLGFLAHLQDIETRVIDANSKTDVSLGKLRDVSNDLKEYDRGREPLEKALREARAFTRSLGDRIQASREVMRAAHAKASLLRAELVAAGSGNAATKIAGSALADRLLPLVEEVLSDLDTGRDDLPEHSRAGLHEQDRLLEEVSVTIENLIDDYAAMIRMKIDRMRIAQRTGAELEYAIREALAATQAGDIIRQQIELIAGMILKLRVVAEAGRSEDLIASMLSDLISDIPSCYVMRSQHDVHLAVTGRRSPSGPDPDEELPRFELF